MLLTHLLIKLQLERSFHVGEGCQGTSAWLLRLFGGGRVWAQVGGCRENAIRGLQAILRPLPEPIKAQGARAPQTLSFLHPCTYPQQEHSSSASPRHHVQTVHYHLPDRQPQGFQHSLSHQPSHRPLSLQLRVRDPLL